MHGNKAQNKESWGSGDAYENYMGRWSRHVAREFLAWLAVPTQSRWLDVGCGTGALTQTILQVAQPVAVTAIDRSPAFIAYAHEQLRDERVHFEGGDAQKLSVADGYYDAVVSGLMLNFVPDPKAVVAEMAHATRPGGTTALYVWDYADIMQFMRLFWDAAAQLNPAANEWDGGQRFPICQPDALLQLFKHEGLSNTDTVAVDIPTTFENFDDYWLPFLGGQGTAPGYLKSLDEAERVALRERLRESLPFTADGSLPLMARAWAVRGTR